jgi:hypothetical protein
MLVSFRGWITSNCNAALVLVSGAEYFEDLLSFACECLVFLRGRRMTKIGTVDHTQVYPREIVRLAQTYRPPR